MIREAIEIMITKVKDYLHSDFDRIVLKPSLYGSVEKYCDNKTIVFEGPNILNKKTLYDPVNEEIGENAEGTKLYGQKRWFKIVDLEFRVRLFFTSLFNHLPAVEKANFLGFEVDKIEIDNEEYAVTFDGDFTGDLTVNFSDINHYETTCRIEEIKIRCDEYDVVVKELKNININLGGIP